MVPRPTPSALAISATVTSWALYRARASLVCSGESLAGRPPRRPRARAAARPTAARSAISSRSNSASAAKGQILRDSWRVVIRGGLAVKCDARSEERRVGKECAR